MSEITSFRSIIDLWPKLETLAEETGASFTAVRKWSQRNNIPSEWWSALLATDRAKGAGLSAEQMIALAAREREIA